jgi:hypothetical protein
MLWAATAARASAADTAERREREYRRRHESRRGRGRLGSGIGGGYRARRHRDHNGRLHKGEPGNGQCRGNGTGRLCFRLPAPLQTGLKPYRCASSPDMVDAENPQDVAFDASVTSAGNKLYLSVHRQGARRRGHESVLLSARSHSNRSPGAETLGDSETGIEVKGDISEGAC